MNTIYIYRTHIWNDFCKKQYKNIQNDCGEENTFLIFDDTFNKFDDLELKTNRLSNNLNNNAHIILINFNECKQVNPLHINNKDQVESQVIIFNRLCHVKYDYMWLIEYDVVCDGNWLQTFNKCNDMNEDILSTCVAEYPNEFFWGLWFKIYAKIRLKPRLNERVKCFFPINRFSKKYINVLENNLGIYSGFCEVYFPTLAKQKNCSYKNVPNSMLGSVFIYSLEKKFKVTFKNENKLYHPFITFDDIVMPN